MPIVNKLQNIICQCQLIVMYVLLIFILLFDCEALRAPKLIDYCFEKDNLPCVSKCERSYSCGKTNTEFRMLDNSERKGMVDLCNNVRNLFANGSIPGWSRTLHDRVAISYSREAEFFAGCYLKRCGDRVEMHKQRTMKRSRIHLIYSSETSLHKFKKKEIDKFFNESFMRFVEQAELLPSVYRYSSPYKVFPGVVEFRQIVGANLRFIGCAVMHSLLKYGSHTYSMACALIPPGCDEGQILSFGKTCSDLNLPQNTQWPRLCGYIRPLDMDEFLAPVNLNRAYINPAIQTVVLLVTGFMIFR